MRRPIDPAPLLGIGKHSRRNLFAAKTAVLGQDLFAEMLAIGVPKRFVRLRQIVRDLIGINDVCAKLHELAADRALAARDDAGQADQSQLAVAQRLTMRAEARAAPAHTNLLDLCAADEARLSFPMIDAQLLLMEARLALAVHIVAKRRAAVFDAFSDDLVDRLPKTERLVVIQRMRSSQRMDACKEQGFIDIDIAKSRHLALIEQKALDALTALLHGVI